MALAVVLSLWSWEVWGEGFSFIFCGDSRFGSTSPFDHPEILEQIVEEANAIRPDFFIYGGDGPDHNTDENYRAFKECLDKLEVPYYNVVGNHDIYLKATGGCSRENHRKFFGRTYFSFEHDSTYFVILDTAGKGKRPWGVRASCPEQWGWMMEELEKGRRYRHTIVVTHVPPYDAPFKVNHAFTDTSEAREFVEVMARYGVDAVFCSHEHLYYRADWGGVPYFISGGAGAVLYAPPKMGGFYHYLEVHVGEEIEVRVIPLLRWLSIFPNSAKLEVGDTLRLRAFGADPTGRTISVGPPMWVRWTSSDTSVGRVDSVGTFVALSEGDVEVTVRCGLRYGRAHLSVVRSADTGDAGTSPVPEGYSLHSFPNPFNDVTSISFEVPAGCKVALGVYDVLGRKVRTLVDMSCGPGRYSAPWDGREVASGVYIVRMEAGEFSKAIKVTLLR